jgi:hypothetical protein
MIDLNEQGERFGEVMRMFVGRWGVRELYLFEWNALNIYPV